MKEIIIMNTNKCVDMFRICLFVLVALQFFTGCKKEEVLQSTEEKNYLVVSDNPSDPVDHERFLFFQSTKVPVYYNDTIARKETGTVNGIQQYAYVRLAVAYSPSGIDIFLRYTLLNNRESVIPMLGLLKNKVLSRLPASLFIPSILLVDSLTFKKLSRANNRLNAYAGFNTLAVRSVDPDTMTNDQIEHFVSSILAMVAEKRLNLTKTFYLDTAFYSVSRKLAAPFSGYNLPVLLVGAADGIPENIGFIQYYYGWDNTIYLPSPNEDLRSFIEAALFYDTAAFSVMYSQYPVVIKKFTIIKKMVKELGFRVSD